jgi:hypothetical protein
LGADSGAVTDDDEKRRSLGPIFGLRDDALAFGLAFK